MFNNRTAIVVLSHNNSAITKRFLLSLYENTEDFDLIMIDNGSTDDTVEYLDSKEYVKGKNKDPLLVYNEENLGVIGGRNQGYALYQTLEHAPEFLCFLDNDQFVRKGWLEQYHYFKEKGDYDIVGADAWKMDSSFMPKVNCRHPGEVFSYVGCGGMMISKHVLDEIGLFDNRFNPAYFEDPDFNLRAIQKGFKIGWNYLAKITHLPHQTLGKSKDRMKFFTESYIKFKYKWKGHDVPYFRQQAIT